MIAVLDVSAAFALITGQPQAAMFERTIEDAAQVLAPQLYCSEAANTAWKYFHIRNLSPGDALFMAEKAISLVDVFEPVEELWKPAFSLSIQLRHSTYDCFYLVLAQQLHATLLTADRKLATFAQSLGISVVV